MRSTLFPFVLCLAGCVLWFLWKFITHAFPRLNLANIPGPAPKSFLMGDILALFHRHQGWEYTKMLTDKYGGVVRLRGPLNSNILYVHDPSALHHIFGKDGVSYGPPAWAYASNKIVFGPGLIAVHGAQHKHQRKILNPAFSTDNMRNLTPVFYRLARRLGDAIGAFVDSTPRDIEIHHWLSRAALEYIAQGGMGHSFDPLVPGDDTPNPVGDAMGDLVPVLFSLQPWRMICTHVEKLGSPGFRRLLANIAVAVLPDKNLKKLREIIDLFDRTSRAILTDKKAALECDGRILQDELGNGKDIMTLLLKAGLRAGREDCLPEAELIGQMSTMLLAGTDTTTNALCRILQLLAEHQDIQARLRSEISAAHEDYGEEVPYDQLVALPLLDAVCRETLRLYAPIDIVPRETIEDVIMPLRTPIRGVDGTLLTEIPIPKGTFLLPSCRGCNTAKDIWGADALEWKPDRWLSPLPVSVLEAKVPGIYGNLMSFSSGPRACIGFKFTQLELKVVLSVLLTSFQFKQSNKEIFWNFSGISYPTMGKHDMKPSMVLKMETL